MDPETVRELTGITRGFYDGSALGFGATRELAWPGWNRVLDLVAPAFAGRPVVSVLDVGCGNGRLVRCLQRSLRQPFTYFGFDSSPALIARAQERVRGLAGSRCAVWDMVDGGLPPAVAGVQFDLITAFGVLHHLPGYARRRLLLETLCRATSPHGAVAASTWRITSQERFRERLLSWEDYNRAHPKAIDLSQLEPGDHLVARAGQAPRYCHLIDLAEEALLMSELPLAWTAVFTADGCAGHLNRYFILQRLAASSTSPEGPDRD
ncbi:MAG TPA: class I SAM-dependent methyltransferase [Thermoanaerobaculia bacterium]|nr:class I SAM-dependent methyltransferase [Thermoanaerobaculia bacterium]